MPVTYIGGNTAANASIASLSMTHGLTIQEGDVLIAICNGNNTTTDGITDNNGSFPFTEAHQEAHQPVANTGQFAIFYRVAGASEPTSYTFDQSGTDRFEWILMQFRGVDVNNIFDIAPGLNSAFAESGTTATAPTITTTVNNAFAIAAYYLDSSSSFSAYTNGYTNEVEAGTHQQSIAAVSKEIATAGATGAVAATISADSPWTAHHFALNPAIQIVATASFEDAATGTSSSDTHGFDLDLGDVIIACVALNAQAVTISDNNGANAFTAVTARVDGNTCEHRCFYWVVDDTGDTAFDWSYGSSVGRGSRVYLQLRGVDNTDVISGTPTTGSGGTVGAAGAVDGPALALSFGTDDAAPTAGDDLQWNTGYVEIIEQDGTAGQSTGAAGLSVSSGQPPAHTITGVGGAGVHTHFAVNAALSDTITEVGAVSTGELNASATSGSITHGLDIQAGDFIVAIVHVNLGTNTIADNNGANSFTERIADRDHSAASSTYAVFDRVAGASEPATYSWNGWTAAEWGITLAVFRGVDTSDPYDIAWSTTNETSVGANTSLASANPSTSGANAKALLFAGTDSDPFTWGSINNGFSARSLGNVGRPTGLYSKPIPVAGAIGATTLTWTGTNDMFSIMAALKPAVAGVAVTHLTTLADTGAVPNTSSAFTPTAGALLLVLVTSANSDDLTGVTLSNSQSLAFTILPEIAQFHTANGSAVYGFVANDFASAVSQTVTFDQTTDPADGTVISVYEITGITRKGLAAIRQAKNTTDGANSGSTPAITFDAACLTDNPTIAMVGNRSNPAGLTPPTGWTEDADVGETTPDFGAEVVSRQSGFTGTTITWGATSASNFGVLAVEIDTSAGAPSITDVANSGETPGSGTETWNDGSTGNVITGTNFL